jgi:hypothetical protein
MLDPTQRQEELRSWYSKSAYDWLFWLSCEYKNIDASSLLLRLLKNIDQCECTNETDFKEWAISWLRNEWFDDEQRREWAKLSFEQIGKLKPKRANTKPMEYEEHNGRLYIKVDTPDSFVTWIIESSWKPWVDAIWPVMAKRGRGGWYLSKAGKIQLRGGSWRPCNFSVSHLFMCALNGERVVAHDKNLCNFLEGNLYVVDNTEKGDALTDPDLPLKGTFQLDVDVADPDAYRPATPKRTNYVEREKVSMSQIRNAWLSKRKKGVHGVRYNWSEETA